jgi:DNA-binding winged helix-turn-helix (wHTH) protein
VNAYEVGPFHLRAERLMLLHGDKPVLLGPKVVETLLALVERGGETVPKEALMQRLWADRFVEESNLAQNIYVLRKTFRSYGAPDPIETIPGCGYRLTVLARSIVAPEPDVIQPRLTRRIWVVASLFAGLVAIVALALAAGAGRHTRSAALSAEGTRLYTIGRYYWNQRTAEGVRKSQRYFTRVIDLDPSSPLGYVGMADANLAMGDYCYGAHRPGVYFARARAYALKALTLDERSAPAYATLGFVMLHEGDYTSAVTELRRAIAIDAAYAPAREWYGIALARRDRLGEASQQLELASNFDPLSASTTAWLSRIAYRERRFNDAAVYWRETLELAPGLARHPRLRRHPTWASVENTVHE